MPKAATLPPTVDVHVAVGAVQVALLRHDDVLDVFHGEVVAEGVVEQPLQLVHRQFLHVALTTEGKTEGRREEEEKGKSGKLREKNIKKNKAFCLERPAGRELTAAEQEKSEGRCLRCMIIILWAN